MNYRIIDKDKYYRKGVFRHFSEDCKCSTSMTARVDVTDLVKYSKRTGTKFYINFLYVLSKVLNSRDDYKMGYLWQTEELICYDSINPIQYVFHDDTETCTPVYTVYSEDYSQFYRNAANDLENAKKTREYGLDMENHPNWFDASYISWLSYDSLNVELPDGYLFFAPIVNWGKYREEKGRLMMPVSVRMNHAIADGFLLANVYRLIEKEMDCFCGHRGQLETERLILRPWEDSDAEDLFKYACDPEVGPSAGWPPHQSVEESRHVIRDILNGKEAYAICLKEDGRAIGSIELMLNGHTDMTDRDDECELGYWLGKPFWGQGLIPEAAREILRHGFEDIGMSKVWCGYYEGNTKSRRVQEKLGFKYQWTTKDVEIPQMHEMRTGYVNAMTKEEWQAQ